jgi:NAD(P)-dependent dehydrogenase (short-subunit alcohol dehydrogenase family)
MPGNYNAARHGRILSFAQEASVTSDTPTRLRGYRGIKGSVAAALVAVVALTCIVTSTLAARQAPDATTSGTVLVTGSNRGLGLEFVRQYAARGWKVIATARNPDAATELRALAAKNRNVIVDRLDVEDVPAIKALATKYRGTPIDVLLNNAGLLGDMKAQSSGALDYAQFEEVMAVNVFGALALADAFKDQVAASSHKKIVSVTSRSGIISQPGYRGPSFYRASKVAMNMVMRVFADEVRERNIIVALVSPPPTETDMLRQLVGPENAARQGKPPDVIGGLIKVIDGLTMQNSGGPPVYFDGTLLPW